jgi:hypothetical protein
MSISLAKNTTLFSSKQVLTHKEATEYIHKHFGYTPKTANQTLYNWTTTGAIPCQLVRGKRHYALSDILKFSTPKDRRRMILVAKWKRARGLYAEFDQYAKSKYDTVGEKQRKEAMFAEALKPVPAIQEDLMLQQMETYTEQPELPLDPVDRLNSLPIEERRKVFAEEYISAKDILRNYRTDAKQLARLARDKKLDRITVRCTKTNQARYAYPREQITKLFKDRNSVLHSSTGSEVFI